jgi:hypothetical protein
MNRVPATLTGRVSAMSRETGMVLTPGRRLGSNGAGSGAAKWGTGARGRMMTTPLPTDYSPRPAWWRNRRRRFYAALAAATLGVLGGVWWWYEADFPLPGKMERAWRTKSGAGLVSDWVLGQRVALWEWKGRRLAANLRLVGSMWEDEETGRILEFGTDGRMRWRRFPKEARLLKRGAEAEWRRLEGTRYVMQGHQVRLPHGSGSFFGPSGNVEVDVDLGFPDLPGHLGCVSHRGGELCFLFWPDARPLDLQALIFTRRIDP